MHLQFHNIIIGNDHANSLQCCAPLLVMLDSLFILNSISDIPLDVFNCVLLVIEPQQCKLYASVMESNLLNVQ